MIRERIACRVVRLAVLVLAVSSLAACGGGGGSSAKLRGIDAGYLEIPGAGHDFTTAIGQSPWFVDALRGLIAS